METEIEIQIRPEILTLLNFQYSTTLFEPKCTFRKMIVTAEKALKQNHYRYKNQLTFDAIAKYFTKLPYSGMDPFSPQERQSLHRLATICEQCVNQPNFDTAAKLTNYLVQLQIPHVTVQYRALLLLFKYIGLKEAMIFTALSHCRIWHTICKERRKSGKQFNLDPLIQYFNGTVHRFQLENPFHQSILPRKQVKHIQKKNIIKKSQNALFDAVSAGNIPKVKQLLLNGFDIEAPAHVKDRQHNRQMRVSHKACAMPDLKMCQILHSFGVDWEAEDDQKMSPIFYAILADSLEIVKFLVEEVGVNIEKEQIQSRTPFYWACTQGQIHIIKYLVSKGVNINKKSALGRTALTKCCYLGRADIVSYLLKQPNIDFLAGDSKGRAALHNSVFGPKGGRQGHKFGTNDKDSPQCTQILLDHGFPVDQVDLQNNTPLHVAMSSEGLDSIRLLLAYGASLKARNNYEETPLLTASKFGHVVSAKIVVEQYHDDIEVIDCFGKNIICLTAQFKQEGVNINNVFTYILQPFLIQTRNKGKFTTIFETMDFLIKDKHINQLEQFIDACDKLKISYQEFPFQFSHVKKVIELPFEARNVISRLLKRIHKHIPEDHLEEFIKLLLNNNDVKMLEFLHQNCPQIIEKGILVLDKGFIIDRLEFMKEKMATYCLLSLNYDWLPFIDQTNANVLHYLVRSRKLGPLIQVLKVLSGIANPLLKNKYILQLSPENLRQHLQRLLTEQDSEGFDVYQYSMVIKEPTIIKILEQKIKSNQFESQIHWEVKQFKAERETDPEQLKIFNQYQVEEELNQLISRLQKDPLFTIEQATIEVREVDPKQAWENFTKRKFYYCKTEDSLDQLQMLLEERIVGIDIQYFYHQGLILMSTLQLSSILEDFVIDCLSIPFESISKRLRPLMHNPKIMKIMHGADNDLVILKSNLNLSIVNFLDTSRLDLQLTRKTELKGLGTLCQEYLNITLSKQHQVSEWRIRPLPKAMIYYARRDSMILPFLVNRLLQKLVKEHNAERIKEVIINGCRLARKNKKVSQVLVKGIHQTVQ